MLSTKFFNIRLYLEGLKRLRVIGTAVGILSVTVSALIPIVYWIDMMESQTAKTLIPVNQICHPLFLLVLIAPFFFSSLFSFLNKRKQSDFFHAIPYTRTCVYLSFTAAALSFVFIIMILSALTAGIFWALNPLTTFRISELIVLVLMCMLAAAELSAIMMLAITLTGTETTQALMFMLFSLLTRLIFFYISMCIDSRVDIVYSADIPFLQFYWFLPIGMLYFWITGGRNATFNPLKSTSNIIYSLTVTLVLFCVAWFFYKIRKSETAGNTAPNRLTQHIFRVLFALPFLLLIPVFFMTEGMEISILVVFTVITLLSYYLYELITTKRFIGFGKATLVLPVLVVCCLVFGGIYLCFEKYIYAQTPSDPEQVVAVHIDTSYINEGDPYQRYLLRDVTSDDEIIIEEVISSMNQTVACDLADDYYLGYASWVGPSILDLRWLRVKFIMEDGRTIYRKVALKESDYSTVQSRYVNTVDIEDGLLWSLPPLHFLHSHYAEYYSYDEKNQYAVKEMDLGELYAVVSEEYHALTEGEQIRVRRTYAYDFSNKSQGEAYVLFLYGTSPYTSYFMQINLCITEELMPQTFAYLETYKIKE